MKLYVEYLQRDIEEAGEFTAAQIKKWQLFKANLLEGIAYYQNLFTKTSFFSNATSLIQNQLLNYKEALTAIEIPTLELV